MQGLTQAQIHRLCYAYCRSTTGVSYASPTYYADRLCDRGRLYIPKSFTGDDNGFKDELECLTNQTATEKQRARNDRFRKSGDSNYDKKKHGLKSDGELAQEEIDREEMRKRIREMTLKHVKEEFYKEKIGHETDVEEIEKLMVGNPWKENVGKVMFWM
jgi:eukaryotic translation initiation factor 2C